MLKLFAVVCLVFGVGLVVFSSWWGIQFGLTIEGPPVQGYLGGLAPTVTAVLGTMLFLGGWRFLRSVEIAR